MKTIQSDLGPITHDYKFVGRYLRKPVGCPVWTEYWNGKSWVRLES
ncbi:MAG: hypothetical protein ACYTBZ_29055 [Planctomycetota bacterium]